MVYDRSVRAKAREAFLNGRRLNDIAREFGVTDPETVGCWRDEEGWPELKVLLDAQVKMRLDQKATDHDEQLRGRYDALAGAVEGLVSRFLRNRASGDISIRELRSTAACLKSLLDLRLRSASSKVGEERRVIIIE